MKDFNNCKMYKLIVEGSDLIYIGHTCKELCERLYGHKKESIKKNCSSKQLFSIGIVKIMLIEKYPCSDMDEARRREQELIDEYKDTCVNVRLAHRMVETKEEYQYNYQKQYRIGNDNYKQYHKQYKQSDEAKAKAKEYRDVNKEKAKEYRDVNKEKAKEKRMLLRKENKDKQNEYQRQYRQSDEVKAKSKEYNKQYRLKQKEMKQMAENDIRL